MPKILTPQQQTKLNELTLKSREGSLALYIDVINLTNEVIRLRGLIPKVKDGKNGKDGLVGPMGPKGRDGADSKFIGPKGDKGDSIVGPAGKDGTNGRDGRNGSPDSAEDIRNKLELLSGDERLDAKYIRGLTDHIKSYAKETNDDILMRATAILDQRTSFLINKLSNLQNQVNALPSSSTSAFPQMTTAQRLALSPINGQTAFDTNLNVAMIYINGYWGTVLLN